MLSVYFDSQIFNYLKQPEKYKQDAEKFKKLKEIVEVNKDKFLYFYSHGHILDLQNDHSPRKLEDLKFMETIVGKNYLVKYAGKKEASFGLITPTDAYTEKEDYKIEDIKEVFDDDIVPKEIGESFINLFQAQMDLIGSQIDLKQLEEIDNPQMQELMSTLFGQEKGYDKMDKILQFLTKAGEDDATYKGLIKPARDQNKIKFEINYNTFDFTTKYEDTEIKEKFLDVIEKQMNKETATSFDYHYQAYVCLDIYGLEKEKKGYKVKSFLNDAHHSFYGSHCNYFISNDNQVRAKTKIINKFFNIDTQVMSIDEFISECYAINLQVEKTEQVFYDKIRYVLNSELMKRVENDIHNRVIAEYNNNRIFLGHFDFVKVVLGKADKYIILKNNSNTYFNIVPYRIFQTVTNKAIGLFGIDANLKGEFEYEKEVDEINKSTWEGRHWKRDSFEIFLEINNSSNIFNLVISYY